MKVSSKEGNLVLPSVGYQHVANVANDAAAAEAAEGDEDDEDDDEYRADKKDGSGGGGAETKLITVDLARPQPATESDLTDTAFSVG